MECLKINFLIKIPYFISDEFFQTFRKNVKMSYSMVSNKALFVRKGSDRLCMVVELRMQYSGEILKNSFETYKTFLR